MTTPIIKLHNASVVFPGTGDMRQRSWLGATANALSFGKIGNGASAIGIQALRNISLEIMPEERVALIGGNGAGKSTLMRVLAGVLRPTSGKADVNGRVQSLLSLGAGVEMDRTGHENLVMIARLMGFQGATCGELIREAGEFSDLGQYLNMPVRTYSSGMLARLGFVIATAGNPNLLIVDEAIGAGDAAFIGKATQRMLDLCDRSGAFVMASHSMEFLKQCCTRAVWLNSGTLVQDGPINDVVENYNKFVSDQLLGRRSSFGSNVSKTVETKSVQAGPPDQRNHPLPVLEKPISQACTASQFEEPIYAHWCEQIREEKKLHRKQWEFCYILSCMDIHGQIRPGARALGFGVGMEPLPAVLALNGVEVLATDLSHQRALEKGWATTGQHSQTLAGLNDRDICPPEKFEQMVTLREVDMNAIPDDLQGFDVCWSSCALEHLGDIESGLQFIQNSLKAIKPGGWAIHTTEYNCSSNSDTLEAGATVLFRQIDFDLLAERLRSEGHRVEFNYNLGDKAVDYHVDMPPYQVDPHLKMQLDKWATTSFGILIQKAH
jgi:ABC-type polysaccharide/polyol phosphate transport system ATPase subunit/2-polyprenyl-3-methyl-5-hydroxy-6-metoxy-1,4-benzoquinol methylase